MTALVTLEEAKAQLRVDHADDDADIQMKIEAASLYCQRYVQPPPDPEWTIETVPPDAKVAVLLTINWFYDSRDPGDFDNSATAQSYPPPAIAALLHRYRDPAIA